MSHADRLPTMAYLWARIVGDTLDGAAPAIKAALVEAVDGLKPWIILPESADRPFRRAVRRLADLIPGYFDPDGNLDAFLGLWCLDDMAEQVLLRMPPRPPRRRAAWERLKDAAANLVLAYDPEMIRELDRAFELSDAIGRIVAEV